jgi:hypothetical protein
MKHPPTRDLPQIQVCVALAGCDTNIGLPEYLVVEMADGFGDVGCRRGLLGDVHYLCNEPGENLELSIPEHHEKLESRPAAP